MARIRRAIKRLFLGLGILLLVALVLAILLLRASLPTLDGEQELAGLEAPVSLSRDALGVATISAEQQLDAMRALGFVHAQERYFIMDLTRRDAAGELSELFGEVALTHDERRRLHRFRARARDIVASSSEADRALLGAYVDGVNSGLDALGARPPEYLLLGHSPQPWVMEDSILVVFAMYFDLQDERADRDANLGLMYQVLDGQLAAFLSPDGSIFDAPLDSSVLELPAIPALPMTEAAAHLVPVKTDRVVHEDNLPGSNNWAVAGTRSQDGRAWIANDMHLGLRNPNIWFRARLQYAHQGRRIDVSGVTLPGAPGVVAGSNGSVAWGFTNSYGDYSDRIVLQTDPGNPRRYRGPEGWLSFAVHSESIEYGADEPRVIEIRESIWGPVVESADGAMHAVRWTAHAPASSNLVLPQIAHARDLDEAQDLANQVGGPAQNYVAADHQGRVGWTIMGKLPRRSYPASRLPVPWDQAGDGSWQWLTPAEYPRFNDPLDGLIWTANARVVGGEALAKVGDGGYAGGFRALQIRDDLRARERIGQRDHLDIHLDDRALFLQRWQKLLLATLDQAETTAERGELRTAAAQWGARAAVESVGYFAVRRFRLVTMEMVIGALTASVNQRYPAFNWNLLSQLEQPLWMLLTEQPPHLLPGEYGSWHALLLAAADRTFSELRGEYGTFEAATWGARNQVAVRHPMSQALPEFIAEYLDIPTRSLPGDSNMPRVQSITFGASQRSAVSPGDEVNGYFHMPGGQSGHFLSPFYGAGHQAWEEGETTSFLPGEVRHTLILNP